MRPSWVENVLRSQRSQDTYKFDGGSKLFDDVRTLASPEGKALDYSVTDAEEGTLVEVPSYNCAVGGFPCKDCLSPNGLLAACRLSGSSRGKRSAYDSYDYMTTKVGFAFSTRI